MSSWSDRARNDWKNPSHRHGRSPNKGVWKGANGMSEIGAQKIFFYQDNAPTHTSAVSITRVHETAFKPLAHPPCSPDSAPSDFYLFPNLEIWHGEKRFSSDEEVIATVDEYFKGFETSYFSGGIEILEDRWMKCVEVEWDYYEK